MSVIVSLPNNLVVRLEKASIGGNLDYLKLISDHSLQPCQILIKVLIYS